MIVILTYGKVCSTSLKELMSGRFPGEVFYSHGLQPATTQAVEIWAASAEAQSVGLRSALADNGEIQRRLADPSSGPTTLIVGVRDPVERSLSVMVQLMPSLFPEMCELDPAAAAEQLSVRIRRYWTEDQPDGPAVERLAHASVRAPLDWLKREIEVPFDVELTTEPLDATRGYRVIEDGSLRILLYRLESVPEALEDGLEALLGERFELPSANRSSEKASYAVLQHLRERFTLSPETLEAIYANPYVSAFATPEEIARAKRRWVDRIIPDGADAPDVADAPAVPVPPARPPFRAAVVLPVLNNQGWVGAQLASLFAQWRPDVELVVLDDGSSDASLQAVRGALAKHPEVSAVLLRNAVPRALGVISQVLELTRSPILIQADSDDLSLPGRLDAILACFEADPRCRLVTTNAYTLSAEDLYLGVVDCEGGDEVFRDPAEAAGRLYDGRWLGASSAFHRALIEDFPLDPLLCPYGLDLLLALRAVATGTHHYLCEPLVAYRHHPRNSHRLAGARGGGEGARERYRALELMAAAQRVRDLRHLETSGGPALGDAMARAQDLLLHEVTAWSRVRNSPPAPLEAAAADLLGVPVPPIASLRPGERRLFGLADLGVTAKAWSGFHSPEPSWSWIARRGVLSLRAPGAKALRIGLSGPSWLGEQNVRLQVLGQAPIQVTVGAPPTEAMLPLAEAAGDILTLRVEAERTGSPADHVPGNLDGRRLGVSLLWIEAS